MLTKRVKYLAFLICLTFASSYKVKIGIVSGPQDYPRQNSEKFWTLAQNYSTSVTLEPEVRVVPWWSPLQVAKAVCDITETGASAIVFLGPTRLNSLLISYSENLGFPLVAAQDIKHKLGKFHVSLLPDMSRVSADLISYYKWESFAFIYDAENGPDHLQDVLRRLDEIPLVEAFWRISDPEEAFRYLQMLPVGARRVLLATSERLADELTSKLASHNLNFHLILMTPVGIVQQSVDRGSYKLTKLSLVDPSEPLLKVLKNRWETLIPYSRPTTGTGSKELPDSVIFSYDISSVLYGMFNQIARRKPDVLTTTKNPGSDCFNFNGSRKEPDPFLKNVIVEHGVTGKIKFDEDGRRTEYSVNVFEMTPPGLKKVGTWSEVSRLQVSSEVPQQDSGPAFAALTEDVPIRVTSIYTWPFLSQNHHGGMEGYVIDFLDEMMKVIGRTYEIHLVRDGKYGFVVNGEWVGMVGELVRGEADIAVAPLTKTNARAEVIDFSKNYMTVGLNILLKKPEQNDVQASLEPFSFLSVWSTEFWFVILLIAAIFSGACYAISRFIGAPDRIRALESKGTDDLSPCGSFWFSLGALLFRDTGIYPRSITHRIWALLWWSFCFFLLVAYISSLTSTVIQARTTITSIHSRKSSQEVIKDLIEKGSPAIGILQGGSTHSFFVNSEIGLYKDYARYLSENPDALVGTYHEGITRVRNSGGSYAFIMESTSSEIQANTEPCDTVVSSGYLNTRPFAVALSKDSPLRETIDHGVLSLMESGTLRNLYEKWWHNSSSYCEDPELNLLPKVYSNSMTLHEASGVFYILILFAVISVAAAAIEYYVATRRTLAE